MNSKNYTDVLIGGKIYTLGGLEEESYLQQVASHINEKLTELRRQNGFLKQSEDYQSVMVYLNLADDYFKEREHARVLSDQKEELEKEAYSLKHELVGTQMKLESLLQEMKLQKSRGKSASEAVTENARLKLELEKVEAEAEESKKKLAEAEVRAAELEKRLAEAEAEAEEFRASLSAAGPAEPPIEHAADKDAADEEIRRLSEQMAAMKSELERYRALEAARNSMKGQKGHR